MRSAPKNKYLSSYTALLCSKTTRIEALNNTAKESLNSLLGKSLSDFMSPLDALRFEASFRYVFSLPPMIFPITFGKSHFCAAAYFEELLGRRFAVVILYKSLEECIADTENDDYSPASATHLVKNLIDDLLCIPDDGFLSSDEIYNCFCCNSTQKAIENISSKCRFYDCDTEFEYFGPQRDGFDCVISENLVISLGLLLFCANDLSCDRKVKVGIHSDPTCPDISFTVITQRLYAPASDIASVTEQVPSAGNALELCEYIAGCGGLSLSLKCRSCGENGFELILSLRQNTKTPDEAEFKCKICGDYVFESICEKAVNVLLPLLPYQ